MVMRQRLLLLACATLLMAVAWAVFGPARQANAASRSAFVAPLPAPLTVLRGFDPPARPWLPGNRGVDLAATTGEPVVAAADGVVLYAGMLAGRGVVSISHGAIRTTYEPVDPLVVGGQRVRRGEAIGRVSAVADDCGPPGSCLHWGALRGDAYLDPLSLLAPPRVRLLPIWADGLPAAAPTEVAAESTGTTAAATSAASAAPSAAATSATTSAPSAATRLTGGEVTTAAAASTAAATVGLAAGIAGRRRTRSPRAHPP